MRFVIALGFIFYICNYLTRFTNALMIIIGVVVVSLMIASRWTKKRSIKMERVFIHNLRSRDIMAQVNGEKNLFTRDICSTETSTSVSLRYP